MLVGYARVSTAGQSVDHQVDALLRAGVAPENVHVDVASGAKASRPEWDVVQSKVLRAGDTLVITRLDRLSRSVLHLITLGAELREREIGLRVLEQGIDTSTVEGRAMFGMLSVLAELQRELIVANTRDGLAAARARGRVGGRRPRLTPGQAALAQQLYDAREKSVQAIADLFGVPRSTVYGHLTRTTTSPAEPGPAEDPAPRPPVDTQPPRGAAGDVDDQDATLSGDAGPTTSVEPPAGQPRVRTVDLSDELGAPAGTWQLAEIEPGSGSWILEREGARVGVVRRESTIRGRRAWMARLETGVPLPASGALAVTAGSTLWRSRDLAAAAIARHLARQDPRRRRRR